MLGVYECKRVEILTRMSKWEVDAKRGGITAKGLTKILMNEVWWQSQIQLKCLITIFRLPEQLDSTTGTRDIM